MTLQELLENAHLEALGHLDEREQAAFEAAFAVAPPGVKAQVRQEQARWAPMECLLPAVEAPADLRERVLDAVSAAMLTAQASEGTEVAMRPSQRVAPVWRAASIGLMTAVVVLGVAFINVNQYNRTLASQLSHGTAGTVGLAIAFDPDCQRSIFTEQDPGFKGKASIFVNPKTKSSLFLELPKEAEGRSYRLVVVDAATGKVQKEVCEVPNVANGFEVSNFDSGTVLALVSTAIGKAATEGIVLMTVKIA